jgi:hypothetical protein
MATPGKTAPEFASNERHMRGLEQLGASAATAVTGVRLIEKVAEAAEQKASQIADEVASQQQQNEAIQTGEKILGTGALMAAGEAVTELKNRTEATAKATYNMMIEQRKAAEEKKKKQKKSFSVTTPQPGSAVTKVAKSILAPSSMYQFFLPGSGFLGDAIKKIL